MVRLRIADEELFLGLDEWEHRVREGRVPADAQVCIPAITGDDFVRADSLETYAELVVEGGRERARAAVSVAAPLAVALLCGVQLRIWWSVYQMTGLGLWLDQHWINNGPTVLERSEPWRLITYGLLHAEPGHIISNLTFLAYYGWVLERSLGWRNVIVLYLASVVGGGLLSMGMNPWTHSLGASGGVMGLMAACAALVLFTPERIPRGSGAAAAMLGRGVVFGSTIPFLLLTYTSGWYGESVDNWCHTGGLVTGAALVLLFDAEGARADARANPRARAMVLGAIATIMGLATFAGPRIAPIVDEDYARAAIEAMRPKPPGMPEVVPPEGPPPYKTLIVPVPAGWESGSLSTGDLGWASLGHGFAVSERTNTTLTDVDTVVDDWIAKVRRGHDVPTTAFVRSDSQLAGFPAQSVVVDLGLCIRAEGRFVVRGRHILTAVWENTEGGCGRGSWLEETLLPSHLDPLGERLFNRVIWRDPAQMAVAQAAVAETPEGLYARSELADALLDIGQVDEAAKLRVQLVADKPEDAGFRKSLLALIREAPNAPVDAEQIWGDTLANYPTSVNIVAVADGVRVREPETADALLEIAWWRAPGDRELRKARRTVGLETALDDQHLPLIVAIGPDGQPRSPAEIAAMKAVPLDIEHARELAVQRASDREAAIADAIAALDAGDLVKAANAIWRIRWGGPRTEKAVIEKMREGVDDGLNGRATWMPVGVNESLRARAETVPDLAVRLFPGAEAPVLDPAPGGP